MVWSVLFTIAAIGVLGWVVLPAILVAFGISFARKRLLGDGSDGRRRQLGSGASGELVPASAKRGCPAKEKETLRKLERRLATAHARCRVALDERLASDLARARIEPPLEEAYTQIREEIESIYAFCMRNDLTGTLKKAGTSTSAKDIYMEAYQRDLAKVHAAIDKTEECLAAYERTVATLEVSSVEASIDSDYDAAIEMLRDLRDELPLYNLEDRV